MLVFLGRVVEHVSIGTTARSPLLFNTRFNVVLYSSPNTCNGFLDLYGYESSLLEARYRRYLHNKRAR